VESGTEDTIADTILRETVSVAIARLEHMAPEHMAAERAAVGGVEAATGASITSLLSA